MGEKEDGGPAFPCPVGHLTCLHPEGMSLRDYFAAKALQSMIANPSLCNNVEPPNLDENVYSWFVLRAYAIADAMLAVRQEP